MRAIHIYSAVGNKAQSLHECIMKDLAEQRVAYLARQSQLDAIDTWRSQYRPIPSRNEAIRRLIERGLEAEGEMSQVGDEGRQ
jgi:hypothetical protein